VLTKIDGWITDIDNFKTKMSSQNFDQNKKEWEDKVTEIFETEHLKEVLPLLNGSPALTTSLMASICTLVAVGRQLHH